MTAGILFVCIPTPLQKLRVDQAKLLPFAMYKAFPCLDYYGSTVTVSDIQRLNPIVFRRSDLGSSRFVY